MENLFASLSHPDSIVFLISVLIAFLIGFITAWILWGGRAARARKEAAKWKRDYETLQIEHTALREQLDLKEADLVRAQREAEEAIEYAHSFNVEKTRWQADLDAATEETVKIQATARSYVATIEDLNNQILGLKTRITQLSEEAQKEGEAINQVAQMQSSYNATLDRLNSLEAKMGLLAAENAKLSGSGETSTQLTEMQQSWKNTASRLATLEAKLRELDEENDDLKAELDSLKKSQTYELSSAIAIVAEEDSAIKNGSSSVSDAALQEVLAAIGNKIPVATAEQKDDLTKIKGIGSFIEKKLNKIGILTYDQISHFDEDIADKVTAAIEFFPGRIQRDDWVGQAIRLAQIKKDYPDALHPSAVFPKNPQDLKIVEGIGPKIERLLKKAGINTLQDLSEATEDRLREILVEAGDGYRVHDPSTWPAQADLAVKGEWEKLKEYQDFLVGGRDVA